MRSLIIVIVKIFIEAGVKFQTVFCRIKVNMFTFKSTEKSFNVNVVNGPAFAVHTDFNGLFGKKINPLFASKLAALIGIDAFRIVESLF
jgi:hypothetical protein